MAEDLDRLVPLQTGGGRPPLFCVHAVSGSPYSYAGLVRLLGPDQPVYGFEAPGFDNGRTPVDSLPDLAAEYTRILREFRPAGEYRLLGWSLGGLLAFDMAKRLTAQGATVSKLIMVDAGLPEVMPLPPERDILVRFIRDMMGLSDQTPPQLLELFAGWDPDVKPGVVFQEVEESGILPEELDADLLDSQYGVFRAHLAGFYSMEVAGQYDGPSTHVMAQNSSIEDMNWNRLLPRLREHIIPGTHHSIWTGENLPALARLVQQDLDDEDLG